MSVTNRPVHKTALKGTAILTSPSYPRPRQPALRIHPQENSSREAEAGPAETER